MSEEALFAPASEKQEMMLEAIRTCQITVLGGAAGSGKSYILQLAPLMFMDDPRTTCAMFRRTSPKFKQLGGILDTAKNIYGSLPENLAPKYTGQPNYIFTFPSMDEPDESGMRIQYGHMQLEKDKDVVHGGQYTLIAFDEADEFEWSQLEFAMSRMRSNSKYFSRIAMTCNPNPDHKIKELISWYLDDEGYPIKERDGVVRYFIRRDGEFVWGETAEELEKVYGDKCLPLSFTFVSATIYDNPPVMKENPEYVSFLEGLPEVERARLLLGNWNVREEGNNYFRRENLVKVVELPDNLNYARGWDLASQEITAQNKGCDFSTGIKIGKSPDGFYYIIGDYCEENYDDLLETKGRFRKRPKERDDIIAKQGFYDGKDTTIVIPVDPAAAGKIAYQELSKRLIEQGLKVAPDPVPNNKSKLTKLTPLFNAIEAGLVRVFMPSFSKKEFNAFCKEMEGFDGERSTRTKKDDMCDAAATAFNYLTQKRIVRLVKRNQLKQATRARDRLEQM